MIMLSPSERALVFSADQLVVPLADSPPPLLLDQDTLFIPDALSEADPPMDSFFLSVEEVASEVGLVIVTVGTAVSRVIVALAALETLPASVLYQA